MSTLTDSLGIGRLIDQLDEVVVGKGEPLKVVVAAILAGGHVLLEDVPGVGKTLAAKTLARHLGLAFSRIQFTPDMLPSDVTGAVHYDQRDREFVFRPGPIFAGLVLADEINRAPAKTQSALLQAMQEGEVSVGGTTHPLPQTFHVIATANPIEYEGTFPLPEAQLDRFLVRAALGYPDEAAERELVRTMVGTGTPTKEVAPAAPLDLVQIRGYVDAVVVSDEVVDYVVRLVRNTRHHDALALGSSPRGALGLGRCAQAFALIHGRDFVTPADVQALAVVTLGHRVTLRPELWGARTTGDDIIRDVVAHTSTPDGIADPRPDEP